MDASPSTRDTVCLQCGDVGFSNALVFCVKCLGFAVHRYCLKVIPKTPNEYVRWFCDDCEAEEQNQHALHNISEHNLGRPGTGTKKNDTAALSNRDLVECLSDSDSYLLDILMNDDVVVHSAADERKRIEQSSSQSHEEEKIEDYLIFNELSADAMSLVSITSKDQYILGNSEDTIVGINECAILPSDSTVTKDVKTSKVDPETIAALPPLSSYSGSSLSSKKMKANMPFATNLIDQEHNSSEHVMNQEGLDFGTQCADMTTESWGISLSRTSEVSKNNIIGFSKDLEISQMVDCYTSAAPVMAPIWRGSFNIWNNEDNILDGIMAHVSTLACEKVHNEAREFNPMLQLEMLPISHVWPKSFEKSEPEAGNIALYFFPSERSELIYDDLVDEMVEEELALKAIVQNAELLVFPSTKLPLSHWRFQSKYYLWGVFREQQQPPLMLKDREDVTVKDIRGQSPLSPLSNCNSFASGTS